MNSTEIEKWLKLIFYKQNFKNLKMNSLEPIGKGDNYIGDIYFINITAESSQNTETFDIVLKTSKNSQIVREKTPMPILCLNEIFFYEKVFKYFQEFQNEFSIADIFDNTAKCFATLANKDFELIVLENLKTNGFYVWNKREPMPRNHINLVVEAYGKFHATSAAIAAKKPEKFQEYLNQLDNVFSRMLEEIDNMRNMIFGGIDEVYNLLKNDLEEDILNKWLNLKDNLLSTIVNSTTNNNSFKVICHGDCWNNNFMFKSAVSIFFANVIL